MKKSRFSKNSGQKKMKQAAKSELKSPIFWVIILIAVAIFAVIIWRL